MSKPVLAPSGYKALLKTRQAAAPPPPAPLDPFALTSPGAIDQTVNKYVGMYGTPQTDAQIQAGAQAQLNPIIAAITKNITDQAGTASANIKGNAESLANSFGQIDFGAPYATGISQQAASDEALRGALAGDGGALSADLQKRLAVIGDPTVAAAGGAVSSYGNAAGNTELANGSANLGALLAEAAAAKTYGLKEPGIARLSGLQDIAGVEQNATNQIGDQTTSVLSQLPNIVQAMQSSNQSLKGDRAGAAAQIYETLTGQNVTKATAEAGIFGDQSKAAAAAAPVPDASLSRAYGYQVDQYGNPIGGKVTTLPGFTSTPGGKVVTAPKPAAAAKKSSLTPNESATISKNAAKRAEDLYHGVTSTNAAGQTVVKAYTQTYQDAIKTLTQEYPTLGKKGVRALVNAWYQPGEFGRPQKVLPANQSFPYAGVTGK